jgi:membrane protein DedA with SNARE-associated domain
MSQKIIAALVGIIASTGYAGVLVLMAIQSACIPIPSEIIMPVAGYALAHNQLQLILLATIGSIGANLGSIPAYWLGARGGRPMIERYGSYILLSGRDLDLAERFFNKYGAITVLVGRLLPIIRTFIALPAGIARMNQVRFHLYTFIGSWPWCYALALLGMKLGDKFSTDPRFQHFFDRFHLVVEAAIVLAFVYFLYSHWKNRVKTGAKSA